jgi:4-amino-4-deoxy-L-arabinose transferase-like glycosyltransferase
MVLGLRRWWREHRHVTDLLTILFGSLALRLLFFSGFGLGDDPGYASEVNNILTDGYHDIGPRAVFLLRPITLLAIAGSIRLFGWSEAAFVLPVLVASLVGIGSAYLLALLLFGRTAAVLSACALSLFPLDLVNSTTMTNDILGSSFLGVGATIILFARNFGGRRALVLFFLGGLALGLSTAVKLNFLVLIVPLALSLLVARARCLIGSSAAIASLVGWIAAQAILATFCWIKAGHPLAFVTLELDFNREMMERHYRPDLLTETLLFYPRMLFRFGGSGYGYDVFPVGWFFLFALSAIPFAILSRLPSLWLPVAWLVFLLLTMQFWPLQWYPYYIPIHRLPRFLHIAAIPGAIVMGAVMALLFERGTRWKACVAMTLGVYVVASLAQTRRASAHHNDCMRDSRLIAAFAEWYDGPVFTDPELHYYLIFADGFRNPGRFRITPPLNESVWKGSLVIFGGSRRPEIDPRIAVPTEPVPKEWMRVFQLKTPLGPCRLVPAIGYIAQ